MNSCKHLFVDDAMVHNLVGQLDRMVGVLSSSDPGRGPCIFMLRRITRITKITI